MKRLALFVSVVFHPVFVNAFCLLSLFTLFPALEAGLNLKTKWFLFLFIFCSTAIIPLVMVLMLKITGKVSSIHLPGNQDRNMPYILTFFMYLFCYYELSTVAAGTILPLYLLACSAVMLAMIVINSFYKLSIHMATLGVLSAVICIAGLLGHYEIRPILAGVWLLTGLTGSARLHLSAHTPTQLYIGFSTGFVISFGILFLYFLQLM